MPVRVVHHSMVVRALNSRATASWGRVRSAFKPPPPARFPIPLILPCEILLIVAEMLPPEACACLVNCCSYMRGLYCEDGTFATEQLWAALLRRTFPQRYTGAPGPNAPPRLRGSARLALGVFARDWVGYRRMLRAVRTHSLPQPPCCLLHAPSTPLPHPSLRPFHAPSAPPVTPSPALQAPCMTGVQIAKFVRWASSAHSWYKHMPQQACMPHPPLDSSRLLSMSNVASTHRARAQHVRDVAPVAQEAAVFSFVLDLSVAMKRAAAGFVEQHEGEARRTAPHHTTAPHHRTSQTPSPTLTTPLDPLTTPHTPSDTLRHPPTPPTQII